jgi:hypothetical protein
MLQKINFPKLILVAAIIGIVIAVLFYFLEKTMTIPPYFKTGAIVGAVVFMVMSLNKYFLKK